MPECLILQPLSVAVLPHSSHLYKSAINQIKHIYFPIFSNNQKLFLLFYVGYNAFLDVKL